MFTSVKEALVEIASKTLTVGSKGRTFVKLNEHVTCNVKEVVKNGVKHTSIRLGALDETGEDFLDEAAANKVISQDDYLEIENIEEDDTEAQQAYFAIRDQHKAVRDGIDNQRGASWLYSKDQNSSAAPQRARSRRRRGSRSSV